MRRVLIATSITWVAVLPLAAFAASHPHGSEAGRVLAFVVYGAGSFVCHQLPDRSFQLWAVPMPVCARCTGIYVGAALAAGLVLLKQQVRLGACPRNVN